MKHEQFLILRKRKFMELNKIVVGSEQVLAENQPEWSPLWNSWADALLANKNNIIRARSQFRECHPLRVYMPIGEAKRSKNKCRFALRYFGKNIAEIESQFNENTPPYLIFDDLKEDYLRNNRQRLGLQKMDKEFKHPWNSKKSKTIRDYFQNMNHPVPDEHMIESMILDEMEKSTSEKFEGTLRNIQPVKLFNKLRFQMKIPFAANKGIPKYSPKGGMIDILARIGSSQNTDLAVLELKKDDKNSYKKAIAQSIIYSIGVIYLLRDQRHEAKWWELFGFKRILPETITVHAVPTIPISIRDEFEKEKKSLGLEDGSLITIGQDQIKLGHIIFEQTENKRISVKEVGGMDNSIFEPNTR